jgi:hypothetical protein
MEPLSVPMHESWDQGGAGGTSPRPKVFLRLLQPAASRPVSASPAAVKVEVPTGRTTLTACPVGTPAPVTTAGLTPPSSPPSRPPSQPPARPLGGQPRLPAASGLLRARSAGGSSANSADDPPASLRRCAALLDSRTRRVQRDRQAVWVLGPRAEEILGGTCNATQKARRETTMPGSPQGGWA